MIDDATKAEINRLADGINTCEKNITKLWDKHGELDGDLKLVREALISDYKTHVRQVETRSREYTDHKVKAVGLEMDVKQREMTDTIVTKITEKFDGKIEKKTGWIDQLKNNIIEKILLAALFAWLMLGNKAQAAWAYIV